MIAGLRANSDALLGITSYLFKIDPPKAVRFTAPTSSYTKTIAGN